MDERKKLIELSNISTGYDREAVIKDVNLAIFNDDFIGIIGPNGGGKTTLIKLLLGLLKPFKGGIKYYFDEGPNTKSIGYLPQFSNIDRNFPISVKDVVMSGLLGYKKAIKRFTKNEHSETQKLMDMLGIENLQKKSIGELSGGEMQRVLLSRAIISNPALLILDEPNTFVDNRFEYELYHILSNLNKRMAIMIVSHDVGTISSYIKTIACVNKEVHYHKSNIISQKQLESYNCPIQLITHGEVPHTVLKNHGGHNH